LGVGPARHGRADLELQEEDCLPRRVFAPDHGGGCGEPARLVAEEEHGPAQDPTDSAPSRRYPDPLEV